MGGAVKRCSPYNWPEKALCATARHNGGPDMWRWTPSSEVTATRSTGAIRLNASCQFSSQTSIESSRGYEPDGLLFGTLEVSQTSSRLRIHQPSTAIAAFRHRPSRIQCIPHRLPHEDQQRQQHRERDEHEQDRQPSKNLDHPWTRRSTSPQDSPTTYLRVRRWPSR